MTNLAYDFYFFFKWKGTYEYKIQRYSTKNNYYHHIFLPLENSRQKLGQVLLCIVIVEMYTTRHVTSIWHMSASQWVQWTRALDPNQFSK